MHVKKKTFIYIMSAFTALMMFMVSCRTQDQMKGFVAMEEVSEVDEAVEEPETAQIEAEPGEVKEAEIFVQGVVTFSSGFVSMQGDGKWGELDVEGLVEAGQNETEERETAGKSDETVKRRVV